MKKREWIGDVKVEVEWNIHTGKRQWGLWIYKFHSSYVPEANLEPCGTYSTRPEAIREARKLAKERAQKEENNAN